MQLILDAYHYVLERQPAFWQTTAQHLALSLAALLISIGLGVPLGIWAPVAHGWRSPSPVCSGHYA